MPLQVASRVLELPAPIVRACRPMYLFAETVNLGSGTALLTYRSSIVRDDSKMFADVAHLMNRSRVEVIFEDVLDDENMIMAKGHAGVYLLHPGKRAKPDRRGLTLIDMFRDWGEAVPPEWVGEKILQRLAPVMN